MVGLKVERIRDETHLAWVKTLPCLACKSTPCDPDHVNLPMHGTKGKQAPDDQVVPLCRWCHTLRHSTGAVTFYTGHVGKTIEEVVELGKYLYSITGNTDRALWKLLGWQK